ncbi:MAG: hypothetical protein ACR2HH_08560 [Chthoniobacterales bacterium]
MNRILLIIAALGAAVATLVGQSISPAPVRASLDRIGGIAIPHARSQDIGAEFQLSAVGGGISLTAIRPDDTKTVEALRTYATVLKGELDKGESSRLGALFHDSAAAFARVKATEGESILIQELPKGFSVTFGAANQASRTAIHNYIAIARGRPAFTPAERALNHPGNNLGWDAQKSNDLEK